MRARMPWVGGDSGRVGMGRLEGVEGADRECGPPTLVRVSELRVPGLRRACGSRLVARLEERLAARPELVVVPGWRFGMPARRDFLMPLRELLARLHRVAQCPGAVTVPWFGGLRLRVSPGTDIGRCVYAMGCFEPNELAYLSTALRPGQVFVDVGANEGLFSLLAASLVGRGGAVLAVEPSSRERLRLEENLRMNGMDWVRVRPEAVAESAGRLELAIADPLHPGQSTLGSPIWPRTTVTGKELVDVTTLDRLVDEEGLDRIDLVKLDVEGAELRVLRGSATVLRRYRPPLLLELQDESLRRQGGSARELLDELEHLDYQVLEFSEASGLPCRVAGEAPSSLNVLAVPTERAESVLGGAG